MRSGMSLRARMLFVVVAMVALGFVATIWVMVRQASSMQSEAAFTYVETLVTAEATEIASETERALDAARTLSQSFLGMQGSGHARREAALAMMSEVLKSNPFFLTVWTAWEPHLFDGRDPLFVNQPGHDETGRFVPFWYRAGDKVALQPLVDYDKPGDGDYYLLARNSGKDTLLEPYHYEVDGQSVLMTSLATPVVQGGKVLGVTGVDIALSAFQDRISKIRPYETGYAVMVSGGGRYIGHIDAASFGEPVEQGSALQAAIQKGGVQSYTGYDSMLRTETYTVVVPISIGDIGEVWSFAVTVPVDRVLAAVNHLRNTALLLGLISIVVVSLVLAWFLNRLVIRPLGGEPAHASHVASQIAQGDLTSTIAVDPRDNFSMLHAMKTMQAQLVGIISGIRDNSESVSSAANEIAQGNTDLSQRTEEQAAALQETAASIEELSVTVRQNADHAHRANELAANATRMAGEGNEAVSAIVQSMSTMADSSHKMGDIIAAIEGIAFQTNILALNAAVEAARAGEEGRGFAVVAGEVRTLAQRSATAAQEIKALIETSVGLASESTQRVHRANQTIQRVVGAIGEVASLMDEIASASAQQSDGLGQINTAVTQMDAVTQQNAALVEQAAAAAASLQEQARQLAQAVSVFRI